MKYKVTKKFGKHRVGQIVNDNSRYIRRKLEEGGCLEPLKAKETKQKSVENAPENKAIKPEENKGGKK